MKKLGEKLLKKKFIMSFISIFFVILLILLGISLAFKNSSSNNITLNVYNWGEYIADGTDGTLNVNEEFTKQTGIRINYSTFQSNEALYAKMQSGGTKYDVIIPSDYMISKMINQGMLRELNYNNIPNFSFIDDTFKNSNYDPENKYSVPYTFGTVGIFYNKKMVQENEDSISFNILWDKKYTGKILMFDNPRDAFAIAQIRLGLSVNSDNVNDWYRSAEELKKQKPLVQSYVMDQIFDKMGNNEAAIAPYYSGDAPLLMKRNPDIGFVIPKDGTTKFVDAMCIPKDSEHPEAAEAYINFMCRPDIAIENIKYIGYSSPESIVKENLDPEVKNSKICYPDEETLNNAQTFTSLTNEINSLIDDLWVSVKTDGDNNNPFALVLVILMFVLLYLLAVIYQKKKS